MPSSASLAAASRVAGGTSTSAPSCRQAGGGLRARVHSCQVRRVLQGRAPSIDRPATNQPHSKTEEACLQAYTGWLHRWLIGVLLPLLLDYCRPRRSLPVTSKAPVLAASGQQR